MIPMIPKVILMIISSRQDTIVVTFKRLYDDELLQTFYLLS